MRTLTEQDLLGPPAAADPVLPISLDPRLVLDRLPLADAVLTLMAYALDPDTLRDIFRHAPRSVLRAGPLLPDLRAADRRRPPAASGQRPPELRRAQEQGTLPTSVEAVYGKLRRIPLSLSLGFLEGACARIRELSPPTAAAWQAPESLRELNPVILDGKTIKKVAKRLKATRAARGSSPAASCWWPWSRGPARS